MKKGQNIQKTVRIMKKKKIKKSKIKQNIPKKKRFVIKAKKKNNEEKDKHTDTYNTFEIIEEKSKIYK